MNYEKKYKEAMDRMELCVRSGLKITPEYIFPELAESEDEKVRKALIDFFGKGAKYGGQTNGVYDKDILAWLEKQGETSPVLSNSSNIGKDEQNPAWSDEDERLCQCLIEDQEGFLDEVNRDKYGHSEIISDLKEMYHERIDWIKSLKKRIGGKV